MTTSGDVFFLCPNCGETVRVGAPSCPSCGSDEKTGWGEDAEQGGADYGGDYGGQEDFNYADFIKREFADDSGNSGLPDRRELVTGAIAIVLIIALLVFFLGL
jgi:hypothetical protein